MRIKTRNVLTAGLVTALIVGSVGGRDSSFAAPRPQDEAAAQQSGVTGAAGAPAPSAQPGISQEELQRLAAKASGNPAGGSTDAPQTIGGQIDFLSLLLRGGAMMIPIGLMSLLVVAVSLERLIALRSGALMPRKLRRELAKANSLPSRSIPALLATVTANYRCVTSRILADMLPKIGRPLPELEAAVSESAQHEADSLYNNVRWLTLAAAVTPLIGLLGTVWGMIIAFYNTTQLGAGMNKAEFLAEGIYVALVTTLGGLAVAIPAAICAHYFEGRITNTMATIEKELKRIARTLAPLEGRVQWNEAKRKLVSVTSVPSNEVHPPESGESDPRRRAAVG